MSVDRDDLPLRVGISVRKPRQPVQEQTPTPDIADVEASPSKPEEDDKVGYKNPPMANRFKPGQSGNPKGRPKGSKNWTTVMAEAATRTRTMTVNGKKVRISAIEAVAEQTAIGAMKGDARARRDFINEVRQAPKGEPASTAPDAPEEALSASDEALLADFLKRAAKTPGEGDA